ncbi:MAG: response regulator transcription factor [Agathobacter sp.]|nr:response regulator transcription factor [Agathobacter sp.]
MIRILIAEDDYDVSQLFKHVLLQKGYSVVTVSDGREALEAMNKEKFDLLISDVMMPVMDGFELVRTMRESNDQTPVLMITAKDAFDDMQEGFLSGTDDYMVKPINVNEMLLRVGALLRRAKINNERKQSLGNTVMEMDTFTVITGQEKIILPQKEFMLLYKMASYPGKIFTRQQLMDDIWGYESETDTHTVEVHISRLREKFKENEDFEIVTMRGIGYKVVKR